MGKMTDDAAFAAFGTRRGARTARASARRGSASRRTSTRASGEPRRDVRPRVAVFSTIASRAEAVPKFGVEAIRRSSWHGASSKRRSTPKAPGTSGRSPCRSGHPRRVRRRRAGRTGSAGPRSRTAETSSAPSSKTAASIRFRRAGSNAQRPPGHRTRDDPGVPRDDVRGASDEQPPAFTPSSRCRVQPPGRECAGERGAIVSARRRVARAPPSGADGPLYLRGDRDDHAPASVHDALAKLRICGEAVRKTTGFSRRRNAAGVAVVRGVGGGKRGTCGLWLLFHATSVRADAATEPRAPRGSPRSSGGSTLLPVR